MTKMSRIPTLVLILAIQGGAVAGQPQQSTFLLNEAEQERILDLFEATDEQISADGTVQLVYDFESEERSLAADWFPTPQESLAGKIRWSRDWEGRCRGATGGILIADEGQWFHSAVWQPDVRMELTYISFVGGRSGDLVAAVFAWSKKLRKRIGSNLGTQLVRVSGTRPKSKMGEPPVIAFEEPHRFGLQLKDGLFTTLIDGQPREQADSTKSLKKLDRGQVGLVWSGTVSGIIPEMKINGKIDLDWAADQIPQLRERLDQHRQEIASSSR